MNGCRIAVAVSLDVYLSKAVLNSSLINEPSSPSPMVYTANVSPPCPVCKVEISFQFVTRTFISITSSTDHVSPARSTALSMSHFVKSGEYLLFYTCRAFDLFLYASRQSITVNGCQFASRYEYDVRVWTFLPQDCYPNCLELGWGASAHTPDAKCHVNVHQVLWYRHLPSLSLFTVHFFFLPCSYRILVVMQAHGLWHEKKLFIIDIHMRIHRCHSSPGARTPGDFGFGQHIWSNLYLTPPGNRTHCRQRWAKGCSDRSEQWVAWHLIALRLLSNLLETLSDFRPRSWEPHLATQIFPLWLGNPTWSDSHKVAYIILNLVSYIRLSSFPAWPPPHATAHPIGLQSIPSTPNWVGQRLGLGSRSHQIGLAQAPSTPNWVG